MKKRNTSTSGNMQYPTHSVREVNIDGTARTPTFFRSAFLILALVVASSSFGCGDWAEFGNGPTNPHNSVVKGPEIGAPIQIPLIPASAPWFGGETSVLVDRQGDYYVSSLNSEIEVYDHSGVWKGAYNLGIAGPRAAPYVESRFRSRWSTIFTGATGGGGGFHAINVNKATSTYTMTAVSDASTGPSESSPKRAKDRTLYICDVAGTVHRYKYIPGASPSLKHLNSIALGHEVRGAIALYDLYDGNDQEDRGEEVLVATTDGYFFVLDHELNTIIWYDSSGASPVMGDNYYAGVTVGERSPLAPVALLPIADDFYAGLYGPNSGKLRAIDLVARSVDWELTPSNTTAGQDALMGSVAILFDQTQFNTPGNGTIDPGDNPTGGIDVGGGDLNNGIDLGGNGSGGDGWDPASGNTSPYHATFASTDRYLYGVDIVTGLEIWDYNMVAGGYDAPVVDATNVIYVGDGRTFIHAVEGKSSCAGCGIWVDPTLARGGSLNPVKLGITKHRGLVVGSTATATAIFQ